MQLASCNKVIYWMLKVVPPELLAQLKLTGDMIHCQFIFEKGLSHLD